jgi:hypothetical protein
MTTPNTELIAHWPLTDDFRDIKSTFTATTNHNVALAPSLSGPSRQVAHFNGRDSFLEVPAHPALNWGNDKFSISLWIETDGQSDVIGDLLSRYDSVARRGWNLQVVTNTGVTATAQSNYRHLQFGIDNAASPAAWQDCGRPGNAKYVCSLATIQGRLYAGTFELEADQTGHLYCYEGNGQWTDCGATPDGSNAMPSTVFFDGAIHCSTGRYNPVGSRLGPPKNTAPGGHVYRIEADGQWIDCGVPGGKDAVPESTPTSGYETGKADQATGLTVFQGQLFATSLHRRGAFVYQGGKDWKYIGPDERLMTFTVYRDQLYALGNGGPVYRYNGDNNWVFCGRPGGQDQIYSAATHKGELLIGTWPDCLVMRYDGDENWTDFGRVGYEMEVMAMALYNSKIYFGTLPMGNVWRLDDNDYAYIGNLDNSPEVYLRRVWSMAVYQGKLFAGTLPSGHVLSFESGHMATHDHTLPAGRHHVAAVRDGDTLRLYLDGEEVAQSSSFNAADFDLNTEENLKIGFGSHQYFKGAMSDVRLYRGALSPAEIRSLIGRA